MHLMMKLNRMIFNTKATYPQRMPAEWEEQEAIIMAFPDNTMDWSYMLDDVRLCYREIIKAITGGGERVLLLTQNESEAKSFFADIPPDLISYLTVPLNDTWVRDYGPISVRNLASGKSIALDFGFNGWGLKFASNRDNLANLKIHSEFLESHFEYLNRRAFVLEGGSIESDGLHTLLTTSNCLCSPNRNGELKKAEAEAYLKEYLGVSHILWLDYGHLDGDDTDSHIDTLARICPHDTIIFVGCDDSYDCHYSELANMKRQLKELRTEDGMPFNLVELPLPDAICDSDDGHRLPATYANYLVTNTQVLVPTYGQPQKDLLAKQIIKSVYHDREVVGVDCRALIRQHGSLHCATMQIPKFEN